MILNFRRCCSLFFSVFFCFKKKTAYEMRISDWSSDVCSSDLPGPRQGVDRQAHRHRPPLDAGASLQGLAAPEQAVLETLHRSGRRQVVFVGNVQQVEAGAENRRQRLRTVALHRQAAAAFRAIERKSRDNDPAARFRGLAQHRQISGAVSGIHKKMENRAIMPEVVLPLRCPCRYVGSHPADADSRSEEHTSELQSLMRISYAVFCLKQKEH